LATPAVTRNSKQLSLQLQNAQVITFQVSNQAVPPTGIDIASGYTAQCLVSPNNPNTGVAGIDIGTRGTWTYGSTGLLTLTLPFDELAGFIPTLNGTYQCSVSNDSFTTLGIVSSGSYSLI
jgi:hypothetical protein